MKFIYCIILVVFVITGCKKDPSALQQNTRQPQDYQWTVDTLYIPDHDYVWMHAIWGSSANDVYVGGDAAGTYGPTLSAMWHYNGENWKRLKIHDNEGGDILLNSFQDIIGFGENDIYFVGSRIIVHFDGKRWTETYLDDDASLYAIWGASPDDIWTGGLDGKLFQYDGSRWHPFQAPDSINIRSLSGFDSDEVYALGYKFIGRHTWWYFIEWDGDNWKIIDKQREVSSAEHAFGIFDLFAVDSVLFSAGEGLWRRGRQDSSWTTDFYSFTDIYALYGTTPDRMWLGGEGARLTYYPNYSDAHTFSNFRQLTTHFREIWTDGKEVFAVGSTLLNKKSYVIHGK
ncbi:MAG: hypothetical protein GF313_11460 [Caldithrix sp.]|nr:hypothetical protein [Caldithrix sp.]